MPFMRAPSCATGPLWGTNNPLILAVLRARVKAFRKIPPILRRQASSTLRDGGDARSRAPGLTPPLTTFLGWIRSRLRWSLLANGETRRPAVLSPSTQSSGLPRVPECISPRDLEPDASREVESREDRDRGIESRHESHSAVGCPDRPPMRRAALLVALFTVAVGVLGLVSPAGVTAVRRQYFATPTALYTAAAVRVAMGLVVILSAKASRAPKTLGLLGAVMCLQGLSASLLGPQHARTVLEWETMQPVLLRAGATVALASGVFMVFAWATGRRPAVIS